MVEEKNLKEEKLVNESKDDNSSFLMSSKKSERPFAKRKRVKKIQLPEKVEENPITISSSKEDIVERVQQTSSIDELKDLTNLFGISLTKREIIRASKESDLMDKLLEQAEERIVEKGDYLSNSDLLDYMKTLQTNVDKSRKTFNDDLDNASTKITNTHNEININVNEPLVNMSRESREKILDVMNSLFVKIREEQSEVKEPEEIDASNKENNQDD